MTNCVAFGGTGPIKVVFARGSSWGSSVSDFLYQAENVINNGYKTTDPYKTYINQFSFYADLSIYNDLNLSGGLVTKNAHGVPLFENNSISTYRPSDCDNINNVNNVQTSQYIFFTNNTNITDSTGQIRWAYSYLGSGISIYNFPLAAGYRPGLPAFTVLVLMLLEPKQSCTKLATPLLDWKMNTF